MWSFNWLVNLSHKEEWQALALGCIFVLFLYICIAMFPIVIKITVIKKLLSSNHPIGSQKRQNHAPAFQVDVRPDMGKNKRQS